MKSNNNYILDMIKAFVAGIGYGLFIFLIELILWSGERVIHQHTIPLITTALIYASIGSILSILTAVALTICRSIKNYNN